MQTIQQTTSLSSHERQIQPTHRSVPTLCCVLLHSFFQLCSIHLTFRHASLVFLLCSLSAYMLWCHVLRGVYPCLPLATNAQRTILEGNFIKSLILSFDVQKCEFCAHKLNNKSNNNNNNCCQMSFFLSEQAYTKIDVGWGFAPDPTGGAYSAPQTPQLVSRRQQGNGGEGLSEQLLNGTSAQYRPFSAMKGRGGKDQGKRGREGNGEGRGKGEVAGIAHWLWGIDARACAHRLDQVQSIIKLIKVQLSYRYSEVGFQRCCVT